MQAIDNCLFSQGRETSFSWIEGIKSLVARSGLVIIRISNSAQAAGNGKAGAK